MFRSKITTKAVVGNSVAFIAATLPPRAMIRLPVPCPMLLPDSLLYSPLGLALPRRRSAPLLPVVLLLFTHSRKLLLRRLPWLLVGPLRRLIRPLLLAGGLLLALPTRLSLLRLSRLPLLLTGGLLLPARWPRLLPVLIGLVLSPVVLFWMILVLAIGWPVLRCARKSDRSQKQ